MTLSRNESWIIMIFLDLKQLKILKSQKIIKTWNFFQKISSGLDLILFGTGMTH